MGLGFWVQGFRVQGSRSRLWGPSFYVVSPQIAEKIPSLSFLAGP